MKIRGNRLITMLLLCLTWTGCSSRQANPLVQAETNIQEEALPGSETKQEAQANPPQGPDFEDLLIQTPEPLSGEGEMPASTAEPADTGFDFTICFAGDINLDENWYTTRFLNEQPGGIYDCISQELVEVMRAADIMCLNNEFTYSTGGAPLPGKAYTFRADPARVEVLGQLGVDAVTLANNHVYDYGEEA